MKKISKADLLRTDAIGNRAKREKYHQVYKEEEHAKRKVEEWGIELDHWEDLTPADGLSQGEIDNGRTKATHKVAEWGSRLRHAAQGIEELTPQILSAWD